MSKLSEEAISTIYQMSSHFKNGEIESERLFKLGGFLASHQRLEIAAHQTLDHLNWLNSTGRFTPDEWAILSNSLQEALAEEAQTIHPVVIKGEPALIMQEAAVYLALSERDFHLLLRDLHQKHEAGTVDREIQRHKQEGKKEIYIHIADLDWMKERKKTTNE